MSLTIQNLPKEIKNLIFRNLEFNDLINAMGVCKLWKKTIEDDVFLSKLNYVNNGYNLIIDKEDILIIDTNVFVKNNILIRARCILSKQDMCLSGKKVTLVAHRINYLGPIRAVEFNKYSDISYIRGPMRGGTGYSLQHYSAEPNFWSSLVSNNQES